MHLVQWKYIVRLLFVFQYNHNYHGKHNLLNILCINMNFLLPLYEKRIVSKHKKYQNIKNEK